MDTPDIDLETKNQEMRAMLLAAPVWDSPLWDALQGADYITAENRFSELLKEEYAPEEWSLVYWDGILGGIQSFRGDIDILVWNTMALPALARAILKTATPKNLESMYRSLPIHRVRSFHSLLASSIPGSDLITKKVWLQDQNPDLSQFFNTNIAGLSLGSKNENVMLQQGTDRVQVLPSKVLSLLFSTEAAGIISQLGTEQKLSEEQTHALAVICGDIILGFKKISGLSQAIKEQTGLAEDKSLILVKALEEKMFASVKKEIESIYDSASSSSLKPLPDLPEKDTKKEVIGDSKTFSDQKAPALNIPKSLAQQPDSFFKPRPQEPEKASEAPVIAPVIIHQETRAESISTAPKLGFKTSGNKLSAAKDSPEPLRAAELTMSGKPDLHGTPEEDDHQKQKSTTTPISPLGAKLTISKDAFGAATLRTSEKPSGTGLLEKIKNVFSKDPGSVVSEKMPEVPLPPKLPSPLSPLIPSKKDDIQSNAGISIKVPVQKTEAPKPVAQDTKAVPVISPLPIAAKESLKEPVSILPKTTSNTSPNSPAPTFQNLLKNEAPKDSSSVSIQPPKLVTPTQTTKVDLKKISDVITKEVPEKPAERKSRFLSRLFKKNEGSEKVIIHPLPKNDTPPLKNPDIKTPALNIETPPPTPLPPTPPAPPQGVVLPKNIEGVKAQPLPAQKISPLSGLTNNKPPVVSTPSTNPQTQQTPPSTTKDIITTPPKVINYSEYPVTEKSDK